MERIWGSVSAEDAARIDRAAEQVEMKRAKFVVYAVLEQVERIERAGAAPIPDQGTVPGEESARPGEVQRLLDVTARVRGELAVAETKVLVADFPGPGGRIGAQYCWIYPTGLHTFAVRGR